MHLQSLSPCLSSSLLDAISTHGPTPFVQTFAFPAGAHQPNTRYSIMAVAVSTAGNSGPSNVLPITTPG